MKPLPRTQPARRQRPMRFLAAASMTGLPRWAPALLTLVAAALVLGGLVRLVTDERVVQVHTFHEPVQAAAVSVAATAGQKTDPQR